MCEGSPFELYCFASFCKIKPWDVCEFDYPTALGCGPWFEVDDDESGAESSGQPRQGIEHASYCGRDRIVYKLHPQGRAPIETIESSDDPGISLACSFGAVLLSVLFHTIYYVLCN